MTQERIMQVERLIAEFDGWKCVEDTFCKVPDILFIQELKYCTSWDWIKPVLEKIESMGYRVDERKWRKDRSYCKIKKQGKVISQHYSYSNEPRIHTAAKCVAKFITWQNQQIITT